MKNPIIVITGPTASGKTSLSFDVAKKFSGEIICADSMTIYRGMDIGTDKPTLLSKKLKVKSKKSENDSELITHGEPIRTIKNSDGSYTIKGIKHHMLDIAGPDDDMNVTHFSKLVCEKITEIQKRKKIPFLVGGSTMYLDAIIYQYSFPPVLPNEKLRKKLGEKSNETLFKQLVKLDPDAQWTVDKNNKRRLIRTLEVCLSTGKPASVQKTKKTLPKNILYLAIEQERETLYANINKRVNEMMKMGFLDEVQKLYKKYDHNTAMQAAGYRQLIQYIENEVSLEEAIEKTKQAHRNFAKRQLTWLKKNQDITWVKTAKEAQSKIEQFLGS